MESQCDILLINPPLPNFEETPYPPLGLAYMAAMLEGRFNVKILDMPILKAGLEDARQLIKASQPRFVGIACLAANYLKALRLAEIAKTATQSPLVVMGGPHASFADKMVLTDSVDVDAIVRGEGELTMLELAEACNSGSDFENILGLTFRKGQSIIRNANRPLLKNIDDFPIPARHLLPMDKYRKATEWTSLISSRGCAYGCIFCAASAIWQHTTRRRNPSSVIDELNHVKDNYRFNKFAFVDDYFVLDAEGLDIVRQLTDLRVRWSCSTRVDNISKGILEEMHESGCEKVTFGLESGVNHVLDQVQKGTNIDQVRKAVEWAKECGIEVKLNFMFGLPGETREDMRKTLNTVKELHPSSVTFGQVIPYPGASLTEHPEKYGISWSDKFWWRNENSTPSVCNCHITSTDISAILSEARKEVEEENILVGGVF